MIVNLIIIAFIVIFDQISKYFAARYLVYGETKEFLHPILDFHYHENRGAAWGILADTPWVFMILSTAAIIGILVFLFINRRKKLSPLLRYGLVFIAGGGIGNMIDRIGNGYVVDFLEFGFFEFPIFNVADSFVTIGAALIIVYLIIDCIREVKKKHTMNPGD